MKHRVLILTEGNIYERRGLFNAVINRAKHLKKICNFDIDILLLSSYEPWIVRKLRKTKKQEKPNQIEIDGLKIKVDWRRFSLIDYVLHVKMHRNEIFRKLHNHKVIKLLKGYDLIIAHSTLCGQIALAANKSYNIPYTITWHGSDINLEPFVNPTSRQSTINIIEKANMNFFVSKALMDKSNMLTEKGHKMVLYNGYNLIFKKYSLNERIALKQKYNVTNKKVVVFAGNFLAVKNILIVPLIFKAIYKKFTNVIFWMIGDGKFRSQVEELSKELPIHFWGNQEPESMPNFLNASDVLILPSLNEGLPLIVVEGIICGCNVVGSLIGGIPEVIGKTNCIDLKDTDFVNKFADKVVSFLTAQNHIDQILSPKFNWNESAKLELEIVNTILNKNKESV